MRTSSTCRAIGDQLVALLKGELLSANRVRDEMELIIFFVVQQVDVAGVDRFVDDMPRFFNPSDQLFEELQCVRPGQRVLCGRLIAAGVRVYQSLVIIAVVVFE